MVDVLMGFVVTNNLFVTEHTLFSTEVDARDYMTELQDLYPELDFVVEPKYEEVNSNVWFM